MVEALRAIAPGKHYVMWDHDAAPTCLWEVDDILKRGIRGSYPCTDHHAGHTVLSPGMLLISENNSIVNAGIVSVVSDTRFDSHYDGPHGEVSADVMQAVLRTIPAHRRFVLTPPSHEDFLAAITAAKMTDEGRV